MGESVCSKLCGDGEGHGVRCGRLRAGWAESDESQIRTAPVSPRASMTARFLRADGQQVVSRHAAPQPARILGAPEGDAESEESGQDSPGRQLAHRSSRLTTHGDALC